MKFHVVLLSVFLVCGCKTASPIGKVRPDGSTVHELRYDPGSGLVSFLHATHPPVAPPDIVKALKKTKVPPGDEIHIQIPRHYDQTLITEITKSLYNNGYRVIFCTEQTAFSQGGFFKHMDRPPTTASPRREAEAFSKEN